MTSPHRRPLTDRQEQTSARLGLARLRTAARLPVCLPSWCFDGLLTQDASSNNDDRDRDHNHNHRHDDHDDDDDGDREDRIHFVQNSPKGEQL